MAGGGAGSRGVGVAKGALEGLAGDPAALHAALRAAARADPGGPAERLLALLAERAPAQPGAAGAADAARAGRGQGAWEPLPGAAGSAREGGGFLPREVRHIVSEKPSVAPGVLPPTGATHCFKVLARVGSTYRSVYDGVTVYRPGLTLHQRAEPRHGGGLYVFGSVGMCFRPDKHMFPDDAELRRYPKAIARCWAWNEDRKTPPIQYGPKLAFDYLHVAEIIEHPRERARNRRAMDELELDAICSMEAVPAKGVGSF